MILANRRFYGAACFYADGIPVPGTGILEVNPGKIRVFLTRVKVAFPDTGMIK